MDVGTAKPTGDVGTTKCKKCILIATKKYIINLLFQRAIQMLSETLC